MSSKKNIFKRLRGENSIPKIPLPKMDIQAVVYENRLERFQEVLKSVGGKSLKVRAENLFSEIKSLYPDIRNVATHIPLSRNARNEVVPEIDLTRIDNPHRLADLDVMVAKGIFGVAENGAVWVEHPSYAHRVSYFIAEHLILVVNKDDIVNNMHEAYERVSRTTLDGQNYGVFISGPSKTADIEQSLVVGAHGPTSMHVFLLDD